jgi:hypothetical protein
VHSGGALRAGCVKAGRGVKGQGRRDAAEGRGGQGEVKGRCTDRVGRTRLRV